MTVPQLPQEEIVRLMSDYVSLIRTGDRYIGYCPACHSVPPRMAMRPDVGEWHCFTCHAGGDLVEFLQVAAQLSREDAERVLQSFASESAARQLRPEPPPAAEASGPETSEEALLRQLTSMRGVTGGAVVGAGGRVLAAKGLSEEAILWFTGWLEELRRGAVKTLGEPDDAAFITTATIHCDLGFVLLLTAAIDGTLHTLVLTLDNDSNEALVLLSARSQLNRLKAGAG